VVERYFAPLHTHNPAIPKRAGRHSRSYRQIKQRFFLLSPADGRGRGQLVMVHGDMSVGTEADGGGRHFRVVNGKLLSTGMGCTGRSAAFRDGGGNPVQPASAQLVTGLRPQGSWKRPSMLDSSELRRNRAVGQLSVMALSTSTAGPRQRKPFLKRARARMR